MKKLLQSATSLFVAMALICAPVVDAQTRGRQGRSSDQTSRQYQPSDTRAGSTNYRQHGSNGSNRPNNKPNHRPNHNRPDNGHNSYFRPEHGSHNHNRPGHGQNHGYKHEYHHSHNHGYHHGYHYGYRPHSRPVHHGHHFHHHVPFFNGFHRPMPPARWHYCNGGLCSAPSWA